MNIISVLNKLRLYCESHDFKGYDACDGTASPILTRTLLNRSPAARFIFMQATGFRIAYINVRPLLFVPKYHNAKGIALFLNGYCNLYELMQKGVDVGMTGAYCMEKISHLAELLVSMRNTGYSGACWGYPTAWQGRRAFYFPPNTPTVVATSFAVEALFHAYGITGGNIYRETALSAAEFVLHDLRRTPLNGGFMLSYSPVPGNNQVHNASLLGARILMQCYEHSKNEEYPRTAKQIIRASAGGQFQDGSWVYGLDKTQGWVDNFHTGYNLEAVQAYQDISSDNDFQDTIRKGLNFMLDNHFEKDYVPKYYHDKRYPVDIHCCGEIFVVLYKLRRFENNRQLAEGVLDWTLRNMWDEEKGFFYFQKHKHITNRTPLMRWSQAFMFNALTYYLKSANMAE